MTSRERKYHKRKSLFKRIKKSFRDTDFSMATEWKQLPIRHEITDIFIKGI